MRRMPKPSRPETRSSTARSTDRAWCDGRLESEVAGGSLAVPKEAQHARGLHGTDEPRVRRRSCQRHCRSDLADDVRRINASLELIQRTRGGGWPKEAVTQEGNYVDLVCHELEFREAKSFTYVLRRTTGEYLGCAYLY